MSGVARCPGVNPMISTSVDRQWATKRELGLLIGELDSPMELPSRTDGRPHGAMVVMGRHRDGEK
jgi:hypothetical protein